MAHALGFDVTSDAGQAIIDLFDGIKTIEAREGHWPGGDVVEALETWFVELGFDIDGPPVGAPAE